MSSNRDDLNALAVDVLISLSGSTLAVAESLTGGLICSTLTQVPGASAVFRGGVVAYSTDLKSSLLNVDAQLLEHGAVQAQVAFQMALGVCRTLKSEYGLSVTGVAGPADQDGQKPGTVFLSVVKCAPDGTPTRMHTDRLAIVLEGVALIDQRAYIRRETARAAFEALLALSLGQRSE